jgi:hypothetical protein
MSNRWKLVLGITAALSLAFLFVAEVALAQGGPSGSGRRGTGSERSNIGTAVSGAGARRGSSSGKLGSYSGATLDPQEEQALLMAIDDEYKALATYLGVMEHFGQVYPFVRIANAEEQHIAALERLFARYGLAIPENAWIGSTPVFDSIADACAAGVEAEIENAALYDRLFSTVDSPDIVRVFTNLRNASELKHLPAFSSCAE